ncbi:MAG: alpha-N-arabinofuranosidase [Spirochaetota bacterium]
MNKIIVNADQARTRISRHIYGHFAEHLGGCIYGGIWVGEQSSIPNIRGMRRDVVDALKAIRIPNLRWPGGCFADDYHWKDGVGPREKRASMVNAHWGGTTEDNSFGTHEFLALCEELECEAYICGNVGSGTVREMSDWVQYTTSPASCPMTDWRVENGRKEPWRVRFWGVGNESWGCGGWMRAEYYADVYRRYACYLRNQPDNELYKIAVGANTDDYHWTEVLMREAGEFMNGLSLHYYTVTGTWENKSKATEFTEGEWFECLKRARRMDELVRRHSSVMDRYDPEQKVGLIVDEWGTWHQVEPGTNPAFLFQQNTLRDALVAGLSLNIFNRHADRVHMANIAQTVNVLQAMVLTDGEKMVLTPSYHVFEMYKGHQDATLVPVDLTSETYASGDGGMDALDVSASVDSSGKLLMTICNTDPTTAQDVTCDVRGMGVRSVRGRVLTAPKMNAHNTFDAPEQIVPTEFTGARLDNGTLELKMPAKAVVALELE